MSGVLFWCFASLIFYVYAGYPILLTCLSMIKPDKKYTLSTKPEVTLLIAAYNEEKVIKQKIENSLELDYNPGKLQIIVAADGSDDNTVDIVRSFFDRNIELSFDFPRQGKMSAINRAIKRTKGEIIIFSDANNFYDRDLINKLIMPFGDKRVGAVSGAKSVIMSADGLSSAESIYWKYEAYIKKRETKLGSCIGVPGEVFAIRKHLFKPPPQTIINDDFYLAMQIIKAGYNVHYSPEARSYEPASLTLQDEMTRRSRIIAGRYQFLSTSFELLPWKRPIVMWQLISHKLLRPVVPFAMIAIIITNFWAVFMSGSNSNHSLLHLASPYNWIMLFLQIVFYFSAWAGKYVKKPGSALRFSYIPRYFVFSNISALKGMIQFITGNHSVLWQRVRRG